MNWSAALVALVPLMVVTVIPTTPEPAGLTAVIEVSDATLKLAAGVTPKATAVAPVNPVPVRVTLVPPESGPTVGMMAVTVGAPAAATEVEDSATTSKAPPRTPARRRLDLPSMAHAP